MLTCTIEAVTAIPVRALPFVTGGTFLPADLAELFYDPEAHADAKCSPPSSYWVSDGTMKDASSASWKLVRLRLQSRPTGATDPLADLGILPAGVFVRRDEFKAFYNCLTPMSADAGTMGFRAPPAGEWGWDENAPVSPEQRALIWEGFDLGRPAIDFNARAKELAQRMRQQDGVWPTKTAVAKALAGNGRSQGGAAIARGCRRGERSPKQPVKDQLRQPA
jgi:hypothetical protein